MGEYLFTDALMNIASGEVSMDVIVGFLGGTVVFGILTLLTISFFMWVINSISRFLIFKKAGEKGWKALIPVYNSYTLYKLVWNTKMFWFALGSSLLWELLRIGESMVFEFLALPFGIVFVVIYIKAAYKFSLAFGHKKGFAVGYFFFTALFSLITALGNSTYVGNDTENK
ncbi:MAG: hypothetical protein II339_01185 [Spirochaetales bacterium]|nr:hypothetical protein [Spirochaetales bacterium]